MGLKIDGAVISGSEFGVLVWLAQLPLASGRELASACPNLNLRVYDVLRSLESRGLAHSGRIGWMRREADRWWVSELGLSVLGGEYVGFNTLGGLSRLVDSLPAVEGFYSLLAAISGGNNGSLAEFHWLRRRVSFDAVARFDQGWAMLVWSGFYNQASHLDQRLGALASEVQDASVNAGRTWPGLICLVARDAWQCEVARVAAKQKGILDRCLFYNVASGDIEGSRDVTSSSGQIGERRLWYDGRCDDVSEIVTSHPVHGTGEALRLLDVLEEWPGAAMRQIGSMTEWNWVRLTSALHTLVDYGLVVESDGHWFVSGDGLRLGARRDRASVARVCRRFGTEQVIAVSQGARRQHEQGLLDLMSRFRKGGCVVAVGHRAGRYMLADDRPESVGRRRTSQMPDAVVRLEDGPYGSGWYYVEYELRSRSPSTVRRKLVPYTVAGRLDDYPVLMVCRDRRSESVFRELAVGLKLATTTAAEVKKGRLVGDDTVWRPVGVTQ